MKVAIENGYANVLCIVCPVVLAEECVHRVEESPGLGSRPLDPVLLAAAPPNSKQPQLSLLLTD